MTKQDYLEANPDRKLTDIFWESFPDEQLLGENIATRLRRPRGSRRQRPLGGRMSTYMISDPKEPLSVSNP
jgi:hypothetical protein